MAKQKHVKKKSYSLTEEMLDRIEKRQERHFTKYGHRPSESHILREIVGRELEIPKERWHEQPARKRKR